MKLGYIHNNQSGDDCNDLEGDKPQNAHDEQSPHISRDNELEKSERNEYERRERAPQEYSVVADNDAPVTVATVKVKGVEKECHSPEGEWMITSGTVRFGFHFEYSGIKI
jgi:hypothetical protein